MLTARDESRSACQYRHPVRGCAAYACCPTLYHESVLIADLFSIFAASRSGRIRRGSLTNRRIRKAFTTIRSDLGAKTVHSETRVADVDTSVIWSLWIGRFTKPVPWLTSDRHREVRYAFALVLELNDFVAVLGSNIRDIDALVSDERISYTKFLALRSDTTTEIASISTRSLRAARVGVMRSTQTGRHLEKSLSRVGANQTAPFQVSLRHDEQAWKVAPGSGRVSLTGGRSTIPELCSWFASTCSDIEQAAEPHEFIKAFAHPVELDELPANVVPTSVLLDASIIDDLLDDGSTLCRADQPMTDEDIELLRQLVSRLWVVEPTRTQEDEDASTWRLKVDGAEVGHIVVRSTKISVVSPALAAIQIVNIEGPSSTLGKLYNDSAQPLRMTFSEPSYGYAAGQLFRDHRLLGSRTALLEALSDRLPPDASVEKRDDAVQFVAPSLFGFVVASASERDDSLVCDDVGTEWADFIGVSTLNHEITFYHCKGGHTDVGASGLHEVVAQAAKNLGYLTATHAELEERADRWAATWNNTLVPRLQRGATTDAFIAAFAKAVAAPQATRRVTLVTSSLSKAAVAAALEEVANGVSWPEALHVLWLLLGFVDQCRTVGAIPEIICRP